LSAPGSIVVFLADGRQIDISERSEELEAVRAEIGGAAILRTEHRIGSILEGLTLEQLERLAASNRDRGIRVSPQLREMLARRRQELERPRGIREHRYVGRYILADGTPHGRPRAFVVYASNLSDAAAAVERQAREALGADYAAARCYGTERDS